MNPLEFFSELESNQELQEMCKNGGRFLRGRFLYKPVYIGKKGSISKKRKLLVPISELKILQKEILKAITNPINSHLAENVHAYKKGKSIYTNALCHTGEDIFPDNKKIILKIDLQDFFPSIGREKIKKSLEEIIKDNEIINKIVDFCTYRDELPQGAPTSPILANIAAHQLDKKILKLIQGSTKGKNSSIQYTRYADDLIFSFPDTLFKTTEELDIFIRKVFAQIEDEGFLINYQKMRILKPNSRQSVTGLLVNDTKPRYGRQKYRILRSVISHLKNKSSTITLFGEILKNETKDEFEKICQKLLGHLHFMQTFDNSQYQKLKTDLESIDIH